MDAKKGNRTGTNEVKDRKVSVRPPIIAVVDVLANEWVTDATEVVNRLLLEALTNMGRWPGAKRAGESAA